MTFTDLTFLLIFLPSALLLYLVANERLKKKVLLVLSLLFYACGSQRYFRLLLISVIIDVALAYVLERLRNKRPIAFAIFITGIIYNVGILAYYKYYDVSIKAVNHLIGTNLEAGNIVLPLGLSFYTFKAIAYLADVYKGKSEGSHLSEGALYLSFFAQIQSGPISRYSNFSNSEEKHTFNPKGIILFMTGFSKKILLSDVLSNVVTEVFDKTSQLSTPLAWLGAVCYSLQLYYDFSGYSDMAVGIGMMFGYDCPRNFNYPYIAESVAAFWRRWHITLGRWFRDYIYIPMGGSRKGKSRLCRNLFTVWLLTGLWHGTGWNFVVWGLGYFVFIFFEKITGLPDRIPNRLFRGGYRILVLLFVNFQWVMFRSKGLLSGLTFLKTMVMPVTYETADARAGFLLRDYVVFIFIAFIFTMPIIPALKKFCIRKKGTEAAYYMFSGISILFLFICATAFVVSGQNNPFLYANF